jgi:predicted ATPase/DNA-binding CsgD family transcriptional regulator
LTAGDRAAIIERAWAHDVEDAAMLRSPAAEPVPFQPPVVQRRDPPFPAAPLPSPLTSLVGREREVEEVRAVLRRPEVRLVTLTGPGGVGKTRLAIRVAEGLAADFPGGVAFVGLAAVRDAGLVVPTIAHALGVGDSAGAALAVRLHDALRAGRVLLVLDNLEQVVAAARALSALLSACPGLTILATSREVLRLSGEREVRVPPLDAEAVELFLDRAGGFRPDRDDDEADLATVAAICARLDGLPLAIELAATRLRHLSPAALLARLGDRLNLLTSGPRDLPQRQQTLRAAIVWSHDLLPPEEQALFRRLAVFAGGFTIEGAETVGGAGGEGAPPDVFEGIASLVDKSLLTRSDVGDGDPRYGMLETIRDFGLERLEASGEAEAVRRRHARWCLDLAEQAVAEIGGAEHARWLRRLDREHPNLRQALAFAAEQDDSILGHRLVAALWRFWDAQGFLDEGSAWAQRLLALGQAEETVARAVALRGAAMLTFRQANFTRAVELAEESLALARRLGATVTAAEAVTTLGNIAYTRGQNAEALVRYEEAVALGRAAGGDDTLINSLTNFAMALTVAEDFARAEAILDEALALSRARRRRYWEAIALLRQGSRAQQRGDLETAAARVEAALTMLGDGSELTLAGLLWNAASVARDQGNLPKAAEYFRASLGRRWAWTERRGVAECLAGLAELAVLSGRHEPGLRLFGAAEALRQAIGILDEWYEQPRRVAAQATARRALGEAAGAAAFAAGQDLPLAAAVALATSLAEAIVADAATGFPPGAAMRPAHALTERELEVLRLVATGRSDREIGAALHISHRTVSRHLQSVYTKLGVNSRTAASAFAHRHGLA